jgi:hypothetical protein
MTKAQDCASNRDTNCQQFWQIIVGTRSQSMAGRNYSEILYEGVLQFAHRPPTI